MVNSAFVFQFSSIQPTLQSFSQSVSCSVHPAFLIKTIFILRQPPSPVFGSSLFHIHTATLDRMTTHVPTRNGPSRIWTVRAAAGTALHFGGRGEVEAVAPPGVWACLQGDSSGSSQASKTPRFPTCSLSRLSVPWNPPVTHPHSHLTVAQWLRLWSRLDGSWSAFPPRGGRNIWRWVKQTFFLPPHLNPDTPIHPSITLMTAVHRPPKLKIYCNHCNQPTIR